MASGKIKNGCKHRHPHVAVKSRQASWPVQGGGIRLIGVECMKRATRCRTRQYGTLHCYLGPGACIDGPSSPVVVSGYPFNQGFIDLAHHWSVVLQDTLS